MSTTNDSSGKKIGKYRGAKLLAKGGMGAIYKAEHPTLDRPVVLKLLTLTGNEQFAQRFQREATIMMGFQHVNIVNYYDHFKTGKSYCMVMEYVDGCSVAELLDRHRYLDDDLALLLLKDTLQALAFAHGKGVVHRDIKPANILVSAEGAVKLTDFGIAHETAVDADGLTKEGMTLGTPAYMAPEQFRDAGTVDARADLYSTGVLLYECLTGRKPYAGASLPELLERIRKGRYESLRKVRPESTSTARQVLRRAMRPSPKRRYRSADAMLRPVIRYLKRRGEAALRSRLADLVTDRRHREAPRPQVSRRVIRILAAALGGTVAAALLAATWGVLALTGRLPVPLLPGRIGGLHLSVPLPEGDRPPPPVTLEVYRRDSGDLIPVGERLVGRTPMLDVMGTAKPGLAVRPVLLRPGVYHLKIRIGDELQTRVVQIPSMRDRRLALAEAAASTPLVTLSIPWQPVSGPAMVRWTVRRGDTGADITGDTDLEIQDSEGIRYAVTGDSVLLNTGRSYTLGFSRPGFRDVRAVAWLDSGISTYAVDVQLWPEPAELVLASELWYRRPRLEGEFRYRHGGPEGGYRRLPPFGRRNRTILLMPGRYRLSCGSGDAGAIRELSLDSGDELALSLVRNEDKEIEWIEVTK